MFHSKFFSKKISAQNSIEFTVFAIFIFFRRSTRKDSKADSTRDAENLLSLNSLYTFYIIIIVYFLCGIAQQLKKSNKCYCSTLQKKQHTHFFDDEKNKIYISFVSQFMHMILINRSPLIIKNS
jgi:hypothetical protein